MKCEENKRKEEGSHLKTGQSLFQLISHNKKEIQQCLSVKMMWTAQFWTDSL